MTENPPLPTALLVDDEAYFRKFVGQVLRNSLAVSVIEARDGHEAVRLFQEHRPSLVMLDINMPHMDGVETLKALRRLSAAVPIIMLTAISEETVVERCVEQGATNFIRKDVPAGELVSALQATLGEIFEPKEPAR